MPDGWRGEIVDLSAAGLRIQTLVVLEPRTTIEGALVLNDGTRIPLRGVVAWVTPPDHAAYLPAEVGLELLDPPEAYLSALANLFASS